MPKKVVIKIKGKHGAKGFTMPFDMDCGDFMCCAPSAGPSKIKIRTSDAKSVREVLDGLEQMYEDLYGGE